MLFDLNFPSNLTTFSGKKCLCGKVFSVLFFPAYRSSPVQRNRSHRAEPDRDTGNVKIHTQFMFLIHFVYVYEGNRWYRVHLPSLKSSRFISSMQRTLNLLAEGMW
jgi:hypothetical protein